MIYVKLFALAPCGPSLSSQGFFISIFTALLCCCPIIKSYLPLCDLMDCSMPGSSSTISRGMLRFVSTESVMPSSYLILCRPLLLLPSIFPSIRFLSNEPALCIKWPKYWSFSISPSNEYSELISFRIGWFDLLAAQGTLKSLLQHHNSKISILWHSAFLMVQQSHPYMTTGKTIALLQLFIDLCWQSDVSAF